jgi:peptide deformylase
MNANIIKSLAAIALATCLSCQRQTEKGFNDSELNIINGTDSIMRVLTIENETDLNILRSCSTDLSLAALQSDEYDRLSELMVATVTHPSQDGVGIAGPQVGLNRRIVAVQRFDKETVQADGSITNPFEVYPNIRIVWQSDSLALGPEGCLSVPDRRGEVLRSQKIVIEHADMEAIKQATSETATRDIPMTRDTVSGFTAVIFQHEIDHLDGILYIDRLK